MNVSSLNTANQQGYAKPRQVPLELNIKHAKLDINTQPAVLDIRRERGGLEIDNYPCRYSIGLKNWADFSSDGAQEGMRALQQLGERIVSDNKQFTHTPANGATAVANIAVSNSRASQAPSHITIKYIDLPKYNYTPDKLNISYQPAKVNINVKI